MTRGLPQHWRAPLALLAALWLVMLLLFARDFAAMAVQWWNSSTYNHILFIPPLLVWLVMQRAGQIAPLEPQPWWPGLAAIAAGGFVWLLGDAAGVALLRHLGVVLLLQAAVITTLGPMLTRALLFPLAYALLLVPFGDELLPLFQSITADLSMLILGLTGTPAVRDGIFITTDAGLFEVAEECAGVMFLVAMVAFSTLAANLCFTSWRRRIIFIACALGATVVANAIRAAGTILVAEIYGIEYAVGVDHIVYGWFFFAFIMVAIMLVARRWFDRPATAPAVDVRGLDRPFPLTGSAYMLAPVAVALLVAPPLWVQFVGGKQGALPARVTLPDVRGWTIGGTPDPVWKARFDGADHFIQRRYTDAAGRTVDVALASYAHQGEGREVAGYGQGAVDPESGWIRNNATGQMAGASLAQLFHPGPVLRDAATWYIVAGQTSGDPRQAKWLTLQARLGGGDPRAAALIISSEKRSGGAAAMRDWLNAAGGVRKIADRATESR